MKTKLLQVLACPKCLTELICTPRETYDDDVIEGDLRCGTCEKSYPITAGIPRFVSDAGYASSFGYQWNLFRSEQIDSLNGTRLSAKRFYSETAWTSEWMSGKWILDVGCGAGRFLDVASQNDCEVVGIDLSRATDAARATLGGRKNVHLVQASIYSLPFRSGVFDGCYCIGVIQHTPDPELSLRSLPRLLKPGGNLAVTIYERRRWTLWNAKYIIRPITKRLNQKVLFMSIKGLMPVLFPLTEIAFRIPRLGRVFMHAIPVANYVNNEELNLSQRYYWSIMDTFDMLSPEYDQPQTEEDVVTALVDEGIVNVQRLNNGGLNLIGRKEPAATLRETPG